MNEDDIIEQFRAAGRNGLFEIAVHANRERNNNGKRRRSGTDRIEVSVMPKKYADCSYCGGLIEEQVRTYDTRRNGRLVLVEGVPIGICNQCGEGYLLAEVAEQIDLVIEQKSQPDRLESTPVFSLHSKLTTGTKSI